MKNYYEILGISPTATQEEIKQAYHKLAKQYHPDINPNNNQAEEKLKEINEAYNTLSDIDKKRDYDNRYNYYFSNNSDSSQSYNQAETDYIRNLKNKANNNDTEAQLELGNIYFYGRGVKENEQEAFYWFRRAAINESMEAMDFLNENASKSPFAAKELIKALFGLALERNVAEAVKGLDNIASGSGEFSSLAQYYMGQLFFKSEVLEQDYKTAFKYFKQSLQNGYLESLSFIKRQAEKDNYIAQETLAEIYLDGIMTDKNKKEAFLWYAKAAGNGSQKAFDMLNKYISRGDADAKNGLLELYISSRNYKGIINYANSGDNKAVDYIRNIFNGKDDETQFKIAQIYIQLNNEQEALKWYLKLADNNNIKALNIIAEIYYQGKYGIPKDLEKAKYYYKKAANQNNEEAKKALVSVYIFCNEFNKESIKLFREEAKKGNKEASQALLDYCSSAKEITPEIIDIISELEITNKIVWDIKHKIGNAYFFGNQEIKQNYTTAFEWYLKGNKESKDVIDKALQENNQYAQYVIGKYYVKNNNIENGFNLLIKSANQGNQDSINCLNNFIEKCSAGNQYKIAQLIEQNKLPKQEVLNFVKLYETSSQNGYIEATKRLAEYYQDTNKNLSNSYYIKYENQCIEQKTEMSCDEKLILADIYFTDNTYQNKEKALNYYIELAKEGNEKAKDFIQNVDIKTLNNNELEILSKYYNKNIFVWFFDLKSYFFIKKHIVVIILLIVLLIISISIYIYIPKGTDFQKAEIYYKRGNVEKAKNLWLQSAKQGNKEALSNLEKININSEEQYILGNLFYEFEFNNFKLNDFKFNNFEKAIYWWSKSAQQGNQEAILKLKKLAENQDFYAHYVQYELGNFYYDKEDIEESIYWYNKSAQNNNKDAVTILISLAKKGNSKALLKLEELSKQGNIENSQALYELGIYFYDNGNIEQALSLLTKSAQKYNKEALTKLISLAKKGNSKALLKLEELSKQGNIENSQALYELGDIYYRNKDIEKAFYWWSKAGDEGNISGLCILSDNGNKNAFLKLEKLAEAGNANAIDYCGNYSYEKSIEKRKHHNFDDQNDSYHEKRDFFVKTTDFSAEIYWLDKAVKYGNEKAADRLKELEFYDNFTALSRLEKLAEQGNEKALSRLEELAGIRNKSLIGYGKDMAKYYLGLYYYNKNEKSIAMSYWKESADRGNRLTLLKLAKIDDFDYGWNAFRIGIQYIDWCLSPDIHIDKDYHLETLKKLSKIEKPLVQFSLNFLGGYRLLGINEKIDSEYLLTKAVAKGSKRAKELLEYRKEGVLNF